MKKSHLECDNILEYTNYLEDGRDKYAQAGAPIADGLLTIIATSAMLISGQYPQANEDWEELNGCDKTWDAWKTLYRSASKKVSIKAKAAGGKDQFGGTANAATDVSDMNPHMPVSLQAMEGYYDTIGATAITEKQVLEEMVRDMSNLTESKEILMKTNAALTQQLAVLQLLCTNPPATPRNGRAIPRSRTPADPAKAKKTVPSLQTGSHACPQRL